MSHTLMLRCGRCGGSMEWRVNDDGAFTELLIVPCRRRLDCQATAPDVGMMGQSPEAALEESLTQSRAGGSASRSRGL